LEGLGQARSPRARQDDDRIGPYRRSLVGEEEEHHARCDPGSDDERQYRDAEPTPEHALRCYGGLRGWSASAVWPILHAMDACQIAELRSWARQLETRADDGELRAAAKAILLLAGEVERLQAGESVQPSGDALEPEP